MDSVMLFGLVLALASLWVIGAVFVAELAQKRDPLFAVFFVPLIGVGAFLVGAFGPLVMQQ